MLSAQVLTVGLHTDHRGSVLDYIKAVLRLSEDLPTIWTTDYHATGKKSASNRLRQFLRKGSQGGSAEFWTYITRLLRVMPKEVILARPLDGSPEQDNDNNDASSLPVLEALREGVTHKDELRTSSTSAWNAYLSACDLAMSSGEEFASPHFARSSLFPLVHSYVRPSSGLSQWAVTGNEQQEVCASACQIAIRHSRISFEEEWLLVSSKIIEDFQTSLPESSKDYTRSQDLVVAEAARWYRLQADLVSRSASTLIQPTIKHVTTLEVVAAISVLKARNGKPYGSAAVLQTALELIPSLVLSEAQAKNALVAFATQEIPRLVMSPSAPQLIRLLDLMEGLMDVFRVYKSCMQSLEQSSESPAKYAALKELVSSPGLAKAGLLSITANKSLSHAIDQAVREDDDRSWNLLLAAIGNTFAPKTLIDDVLTVLMNGLSAEPAGRPSLRGLELIAKQDKALIRDFVLQPKGANLMSKLLFISDAPEIDMSQQVKQLTLDIEGALAITGDINRTSQPLLKVIQSEFDTAGPESLS